jgi:hypothetical protein
MHVVPHIVNPAVHPVGSGAADDVDDVDEVEDVVDVSMNIEDVDSAENVDDVGSAAADVDSAGLHFASTGLAMKTARERVNPAIGLILSTPPFETDSKQTVT